MTDKAKTGAMVKAETHVGHALATQELLFRGKSIASWVTQDTPPENTPPTVEEWQGMSDEQKIAALVLFAEMEAETTENITVRFPRVKYPTSGASFWEIPTAEGRPKAVENLDCVILEKAECRVYYDPSLDPGAGDAAPLCMSADCIKPDPESPQVQARSCAECPNSKWGSGRDGRGQACKKRMRTYFLPVDNGKLEDIPLFMSLPPTALQPFSDYAVGLARQHAALSLRISRLGLVKSRSKGGKEYSGMTAQLAQFKDRSSALTWTETQNVAQIKKTYAEHMKWRGGKGLLEDIADEHAAGEHHDDTEILS